MSIKTTTDIEVSLDTTEVTPTHTKDVVTDNQHCVDIENNESIIEGSKKEYSIVGDGIYASISADEAPQWLLNVVDDVVSSSMLSSFNSYSSLVGDVRDAIDSISIASNAYVEKININTVLEDTILASRYTALNATVGQNSATISELDLAFTNLDESFAQRVRDINSTFEDSTNARITLVDQTRASEDEALAQRISSLTASIDDTNSYAQGNAESLSGLQNYVGLNEFNYPNGTGMLSRVSILEKQNDGVINYTTSTVDVMGGVDPDDVTPGNNELLTNLEPYNGWWVADDDATVAAQNEAPEGVTVAQIEETRAAHVGDVYIVYSDDPDTQVRTYIKSYKFIKTAVDETSPVSTDREGYTWALITDTDAQAAYTIALNAKDLANSKRRVFTATPFVPYDKGDLWVDSTATPQIVKTATTGNVSLYSAADWVQADQQAQDFIANTYTPDAAQIHRQLDGKIEYFFYETFDDSAGAVDLSVATDELSALTIIEDALDVVGDIEASQELKDNAHGNIVYFKDSTNGYWYNSSIPEWLVVDDTSMYRALKDAATAQGAADGKVSQFYAWGGENAPADYTIVTTEEVPNPDDALNPLVEEVSTTYSGDGFKFWYKSDSKLYHEATTNNWIEVPTVSGVGSYISEGDVLTVLDPTDNDLTSYSFNGSSWQQAGPTGVISQSKFFVDLVNDVRGPYGSTATALSDLEVTNQTYTNSAVSGARSAFLYESNLEVNGVWYSSGFGLNSLSEQDESADGTTEERRFDSEFWVNAERFAIVNPANTGYRAVFTVATNGSLSLGTEYTEATRNEPRGIYSSAVIYDKGDVVSYNNSSYVALVNMTSVIADVVAGSLELNVVPGTNEDRWQLLAAQGVSPLVYEFDGEDTWPTSTNEAGADEHVFDSLFAGNVVVRVLAHDAEGGVNISLNGGTSVPFTRTLGDNTEEWYQFSFDNLIVGSNTLRFWATNGDGGSIKKVAVSFAGASGLNGGSVDFFFIRSASEPTTLPSEDDNWKTDVTQVGTGAGDLWSIKEKTPLGGGTVTYEGLRVIDAPIIRELSIYSIPSTSAIDEPTTSTYDFSTDNDSSTDSLTIGDTNWSRSVAGITNSGQKIYVSTALVAGNFTETAKDITWSEPSVYAERQDGVSYTGTTEYYQTTSTDTAPGRYLEDTTIDEDWSTSATTPDSTNKYLWNFNRNTKSDDTFTDSAVTLITQYVEDGRGISSITEQYQKGASGIEAPTDDTWSDAIPALTDTHRYLWNQTTINYTDGENPTTVETLIAVKGEDGTPADVYKFVYKDNLTKPSKPTDNAATGWVDEIPTTINNTLWQSQGKQTQGAGDYVWQEPVQITAKDGLSALLHEWSGSESWPYGSGNTIDTAYKQTFTSAFAGNAFIRVNALDAEGGLQIALNNTVLGTMSGPDNATKWYEFSSESLVVGTNTLSFWSVAQDGGAIKEVKVAFVGAQGIQGITGDYVDFKFTRKTSEPADPGGDDTWYTSVTSVPADTEGDLYSIKENTTNGGATVTYTDKRVIEAPVVREIVMYSGAVTSAPAVPTTDVSYNFVTDSLTDTNNSWSSSFPATLTKDKKVYRITAIAKGNITQTAVSLEDQWSTPAVYAERVDGSAADNYKEILLYQNATSIPTSVPSSAAGFTASSGNAAASGSWTTTVGDLSSEEKTYRINITLQQPNGTGDWSAVDSAWNGPVQITGLDGQPGNHADTYKEILLYANATLEPDAPILTGSYNASTGIAQAVTGWTVSASDPESGFYTYRSSITLVQTDSTGDWVNSDSAWGTPVKLTGEQGESIKGDPGVRGTAVLSHTINDDNIDVSSINAATVGTYWVAAATTNYDEEVEGDTLIVTNNSQTSNGGTHIYEYTSSAWASSTAFTINGNAVVEGTLSAAAVGAGHFATTQFDTATALTSAGTTMDSNGITVYDGEGNIRVKIGNLGA